MSYATNNSVVQDFPVGYFAVTADRESVGFVFDDVFYRYVKKRGLFSSGQKLQQFPLADATRITRDEFYKNYHYVEAQHDLIDLSNALPKEPAQKVAEQMNSQSNW